MFSSSRKQQWFAALFAFVWVFFCLIPASMAATQQISYLKQDGSADTQTATVLTGAESTLTAGWWYAGADLTYANPLAISGTVNLILGDGKTLTVNKGILVETGDTLSVYSQSVGSGMGKIIANGADNSAGIGGSGGQACGNVNLYGGDITATGHIGAAGVGGGAGAGCGDLYMGRGVKLTAQAGAEGLAGAQNVTGGVGFGTGGNVLGVPQSFGSITIDCPQDISWLYCLGGYTSGMGHIFSMGIRSTEMYTTYLTPSAIAVDAGNTVTFNLADIPRGAVHNDDALEFLIQRWNGAQWVDVTGSFIVPVLRTYVALANATVAQAGTYRTKVSGTRGTTYSMTFFSPYVTLTVNGSAGPVAPGVNAGPAAPGGGGSQGRMKSALPQTGDSFPVEWLAVSAIALLGCTAWQVVGLRKGSGKRNAMP